AAVLSEVEAAYLRVGGREARDRLGGAVGAPVVDEHDLVRPPHRRERAQQLVHERAGVLHLVVDGGHDRDLGAHALTGGLRFWLNGQSERRRWKRARSARSASV